MKGPHPSIPPPLTRHPWTSHVLVGALTLTALIAMPPSRLLAEEFCVTCYEPTATYRCAISQNGMLKAPPGAQLSCIKELAKQGGHKSCSIQRDEPAECLGKLLVINQDPATVIPPDHPLNSPATTEQTIETPSDLPQGDQTEHAQGDETDTSDETGEPKTVEELAKRTAQSSKENISKAGKAVVDAAKSTGDHIKDAGEYVGNTAKKTWDCIISLFSKCGS